MSDNGAVEITPDMRCCGNCRWWLRDAKLHHMGECHGAPPTAMMVINKNSITREVTQRVSFAWPPTPDTELCAHFQFPSSKGGHIESSISR